MRASSPDDVRFDVEFLYSQHLHASSSLSNLENDRLEAILEGLEIAAIARQRTADGAAIPVEPLMEQFGIKLAD